MKLFPFPPDAFTVHGLRYVSKSANQLTEDECCWHKEDQAEGGEWMSYRLSVRRLGTVHSMKFSRHEFLGHVAHGDGDDFIRGAVSALIAAADNDSN
jgi:hypothetical protein